MFFVKRKYSYRYGRKTSILTSIPASCYLISSVVYIHYATRTSSTTTGSSCSAQNTAWASTSSAIPGPRRIVDRSPSSSDEKRSQSKSNGLENLDLETLRVFGITDVVLGEEEETATPKSVDRPNKKRNDKESDEPTVTSREDIDSLLAALENEPSVKLFADEVNIEDKEVASPDLPPTIPGKNEHDRPEEDKVEEESYVPASISNYESNKEEQSAANATPRVKDKQQKQSSNSQSKMSSSSSDMDSPSELDDPKDNVRFSESKKQPKPPKLGRLKQFTNNVSSLGRGGKEKKRVKTFSSSPVRPVRGIKRMERKKFSVKPIQTSVAVASTSTFRGPLMKLIAGMAGVQLLWGLTKSFLSIFLQGWNTQGLFGENATTNDDEDDTMNDDEGTEEELDEEEIRALERLGIRPQRLAKYRRNLEGGRDSTVSNSMSATDTRLPSNDNAPGLERRAREDEVRGGTQNVTNGPKMFVNMLGMKKKQGRSFHEMQEEIRNLRERAEMAEKDVEILNGQLSDFMQKLEQARSQCVRLQSTNRYLKSQNDNFQTEMEDTLKRERQRATEELARIREAMVEVVDRERQLIRDHMLSVSEEVRGAILRAEEEGSTNKPSY